MDKLRLMRRIEGEWAPRVYTLTGGSFNEMLAAVKELDYRKFDENLKAWLVRKPGLEALKAGGYTVEQEPDIQVAPFAENSINDFSDEHNTITFAIDFLIRDESGKMAKMPVRLKVQLTPEAIEEEKEALNRQFAELTSKTGVTVSPANRYQAIRSICKRMAEEDGARIATKAGQILESGRTTAELVRVLAVIQDECR